MNKSQLVQFLSLPSHRMGRWINRTTTLSIAIRTIRILVTRYKWTMVSYRRWSTSRQTIKVMWMKKSQKLLPKQYLKTLVRSRNIWTTMISKIWETPKMGKRLVSWELRNIIQSFRLFQRFRKLAIWAVILSLTNHNNFSIRHIFQIVLTHQINSYLFLRVVPILYKAVVPKRMPIMSFMGATHIIKPHLYRLCPNIMGTLIIWIRVMFLNSNNKNIQFIRTKLRKDRNA